ncbi:MAG TPA: ATP-binding cassette domain-containing protein [Alphaproteobacteria bacterium]|nr:ATP-binding cassette domain-containing protein [Alphaproteobacteria bacterium]
MAPPPLLTLKDVAVLHGERPLFEGVELAVLPGDRLCLVGRNGAGKSTLLKIVAGLVPPDHGERWLQPGTRVAYLEQEPDLSGFASVADYVAAGAGEAAYRVPMLLDAVGVDGGLATAGLSGGEARRAALARALVAAPDILLLDEPTNHLDIRAIEWLERELAGFRGAVVTISHDRAFLAHLSRATLWLDRGFAEFEAWQEAAYAEEDSRRHKLERRIAAETRWSREGISARRKRNQGRLRRLQELRAERRRMLARTGSVELRAAAGPVSGKLVIEAEHVAKGFAGRPVIRDFSTRIMRGDRVGLIGPNGAGKTTLLRLLTGELAPDEGRVRLGSNLAPVYLDQRRAVLEPERMVQDVLCGPGSQQVMVRGEARHVASYLQDFLFDPAQARQPVSALSGGERNRLLLARALARPSNLLVLDEPTNDLDMDTLDLLQELLADYDGTVLLVSHDRDFLDRVVTSTIALEGDGSAIEYAGGYSDYLSQRGPRDDAEKPAKPEKTAGKSEKPKPSSGGKLSYKHKRRLELLPDEMAALRGEIAALEAELADPALFTRRPERFRAATARLQAAAAELDAAESEWLELEMLREEVEGG